MLPLLCHGTKASQLRGKVSGLEANLQENAEENAVEKNAGDRTRYVVVSPAVPMFNLIANLA